MIDMTSGQLSLRTGAPVRTLRFYADAGVRPEDGRSESSYRLFGPYAVARARLVRTLRELGVGLAEVKRVLVRKDRSHVLHKDHQAGPAPWDAWLAELLLGSIHHNTFADAFR